MRLLRAQQHIVHPEEIELLVGRLALRPATACSHLNRPLPPPRSVGGSAPRSAHHFLRGQSWLRTSLSAHMLGGKNNPHRSTKLHS